MHILRAELIAYNYAHIIGIYNILLNHSIIIVGDAVLMVEGDLLSGQLKILDILKSLIFFIILWII